MCSAQTHRARGNVTRLRAGGVFGRLGLSDRLTVHHCRASELGSRLWQGSGSRAVAEDSGAMGIVGRSEAPRFQMLVSNPPCVVSCCCVCRGAARSARAHDHGMACDAGTSNAPTWRASRRSSCCTRCAGVARAVGGVLPVSRARMMLRAACCLPSSSDREPCRCCCALCCCSACSRTVPSMAVSMACASREKCSQLRVACASPEQVRPCRWRCSPPPPPL